MMARQWRKGEWNALALLAGGVILVAMSLGGYMIGRIIDGQLGTSPTGGIIGLVLGTIIGFWDVYRIAARVMAQQPVPSQQAQQEAEEQWKKSEDSPSPEGDRDESHE